MSGGSNIDWGSLGSIGGGALFGGSAGKAAEQAGNQDLNWSAIGSIAGGSLLGGNIGSLLEGTPGPDTSYLKPGLGEQSLEQRLSAQAAGTGGPSAAEMQLQRGTDMSNRNAMALAASQRGISPGLAASIASRQQGMNQVEANQQAGLMRAQESLAANQLLASIYSSQRGSAAQASQLQAQADQNRRDREDRIVSSVGNAATAYFTGMPSGAAPVGPTAQQGSGFQAGQPYGDFSGYAYQGAIIPGKAKTKGDSIKNDTVLIAASPGEMVIPRTVVQRGPEAISEFAKALIGKDYSNAKKA